MNNHTPRAIAIGAGLGAVVLLAGCATAAPEPTPVSVTITFASYTYGTQGPAGEGIQEMLDAFAEQFPDITVVPQAVPTAEILTSTTAAVAAGDAPDVVQMGYSKLSQALATLPVRSLEDVAGDDWEAYAEGLVEGPLVTGTLDGTVHAVPFTISVPTLFYNADLFAAAGLDPDEPPATIEEVREAAEAIVANGHLGVYLGMADSAKSDYLTQSVIDSAGGSIVDESGAVTVDSKVAVDAIAEVQALTLDGLQPAVAIEDAVAAFTSGNLGMIVVSTAVVGTLQAAADGVFELRSGAFPAFGTGAPTHSGASLVVLSEDDVQARAAWEFVRFMTGEEGAVLITTGLGYLPIRPALVDDPDGLAPYFAENDLLLPTVAAMDSMSPYLSFAGPDSNQATVILQDDAIAPIVLRGADPATTLAGVADRIRELTGAE
jgi:multiple sugar transport system substrate-binding protein